MPKLVLTNGEVATLSIDDWVIARAYAWSLHGTGAVVRWEPIPVSKRTTAACGRMISLHRETFQRMHPGVDISTLNVAFRDGDKLNLTRENLYAKQRGAHLAKQENRRRLRMLTPPKGKSKYYGVSPHRGRWQATIRVDGRLRWLGHFDSEVQAAEAYNAAIKTFSLEGQRQVNILPRAPRRRPQAEAQAREGAVSPACRG